MPIVNGHPAECGCYVEGHWGQYGPDHLADQAEGFGWEPADITDDPRYWRVAADDERASELTVSLAWERHSEAADDIETWLNDNTLAERKSDGVNVFWHGQWYTDDGNGTPVPDDQVQRYVWHWHDGEFFLSPICDNEEECNDDTCAHNC